MKVIHNITSSALALLLLVCTLSVLLSSSNGSAINTTRIVKNYTVPLIQSGLFQDSCACGGGSIGTYAYEAVMSGCIGGCGGSPFNFHAFGTTVQTIRAWKGGDHDGLVALDVQLFSGDRQVMGSVPARGPDASFTFAIGETLMGDVELCGNGIGTRTGLLRFKTSLGNTFSIGDEHTPYYFSSGDSFLTGFFGQSGSEIDHLGLLFMKPIASGNLQNIRYPTLSTYSAGLAPQIYKNTLCNDGTAVSQTQTSTFTRATGEHHTWSVSVSFTIGDSVTVTAGVPEVAQVSDTFHWELTAAASYSVTTDTTKSETMEDPTTVPPRTRIYATFSWWDSVCSVPYVADLVYYFKDGSNFAFSVSDVYTGAYITEVVSSFHTEALAAGASC